MLDSYNSQSSVHQPKFASAPRTELPAEEDEGFLSPVRQDFPPSISPSERRLPVYTMPPKQPGYTMYHLKAWITEIVWCILSVGFLISIVIILARFDGKPMPKWPLDLTLNTLLAFLATICRSMTIIPLAEAISQLKWNWFVNYERPLNDMYIFDQASRGPWGALLLIIKARGRFFYLTWVAAFIFLSGLVTSFITQSAISYQSGFAEAKDAIASAPIVRGYPDDIAYDEASTSVYASVFNSRTAQNKYIELGMTHSSFQAATYTVNQSWPLPQPRCSEIKCEWPQYHSLAMCASISNVTNHLNVTAIPNNSTKKTDYNATLPYNLGVLDWKTTAPSIQLKMTSGFDAAKAVVPVSEQLKQPLKDRWTSLGNWSNSDLPTATISQVFFIFNNGNSDPSKKFRAVEILWHFCVQSYESTFANGTATTNKTADTFKLVHLSPSDGTSQYAYFTLANEDGDAAFNVSANWYSFYELQYNPIFMESSIGTYTLTADGSSSASGIGRLYGRNMGNNVFSSLDVASTDEDFDQKTWKNIQKMTNTMADSMTAFMRNGDKEGRAVGTAYRPETYVRIRWEWLAFLAAQIGLTVLFLISVMIQTAKLGMEVVKSSNMAELFALQETDSKEGKVVGQGLQYQGISTRVHHTSTGKLVKKGNGWHYVTTSS